MFNPWITLDDLEEPTSVFAEYAIDSASFLMWSLSGRKYSGLKTTTEHYVCPQYDIPTGCVNLGNGSYVDRTNSVVIHILSVLDSAQQGVKIPLRKTPIRKIEYVEVSGVRLNSVDYYIENNRNLVIVRNIGACSDIVIQYKYGVEPPSMGVLAATVLANNIIDDLEGRECSLPSRVSSVSRQGINFEVYDPQEFLDKGRLGIFIVDSFLASANPSGSKKKAKLFSADMPKGSIRR
jgi:hypothetical protein